jgi:hypothetical protein
VFEGEAMVVEQTHLDRVELVVVELEQRKRHDLVVELEQRKRHDLVVEQTHLDRVDVVVELEQRKRHDSVVEEMVEEFV